jgi:hypothetical protein
MIMKRSSQLLEHFGHILEAQRGVETPPDQLPGWRMKQGTELSHPDKPHYGFKQVPFDENEMEPHEFQKLHPDEWRKWPGKVDTSSTRFRDDGGGRFTSIGFNATYDPDTASWTIQRYESEPEVFSF